MPDDLPEIEPVHLHFITRFFDRFEFLATRTGTNYVAHRGKGTQRTVWSKFDNVDMATIEVNVAYGRPYREPSGWNQHIFNACHKHYHEEVMNRGRTEPAGLPAQE